MVEDVEELSLDAKFHALAQWEPFGEVKIAPEKIRSAQRVASQVAKLAIGRAVAARAGSGAGIDGGDKGVGIEPLKGAGLRHSGNGMSGHKAERPATTLANCGPLPCTTPFPLAE